MPLTPIVGMTIHDIVLAHDYWKEPIEKITVWSRTPTHVIQKHWSIWLLPTCWLFLHGVIRFKKKWKRLVSGLQQGLLHDELTTYTHDKWVQRKLYASLVKLSWAMGLFYYVSLPVVSAPAEVVLKGHSCCKGSGAVQMPLVAQSIRTQQSNQRHCPGGEFRTQRESNQEAKENIPALQMWNPKGFNCP